MKRVTSSSDITMTKSKKCLVLFFMVVQIRLSENKIEPFVVGGHYEKIENHPHSVFLVSSCQGEESVCGASILNQKVLLSAAHCFINCDLRSRSRDTVDAYAANEDIRRALVTRVLGAILHEYYSEITVSNDIALAVVKDSIQLGRNSKRVIITNRFLSSFKDGTVAGWGISDEKKLTPTFRLLSVHQKIRPNRLCTQYIGHLERGMFCAGSIDERNPHPASGDSGSAMIAKGMYEIGLVSFREPKLPALMVYTNVTYYYQWIKNYAQKIYCNNVG